MSPVIVKCTWAANHHQWIRQQNSGNEISLKYAYLKIFNFSIFSLFLQPQFKYYSQKNHWSCHLFLYLHEIQKQKVVFQCRKTQVFVEPYHQILNERLAIFLLKCSEQSLSILILKDTCIHLLPDCITQVTPQLTHSLMISVRLISLKLQQGHLMARNEAVQKTSNKLRILKLNLLSVESFCTEFCYFT